MVDRSIISRELYNFEEAYFDDFKGKKLEGFNAWQIVKTPLFFELIRLETGPIAAKEAKPAPGAVIKLYNVLANLLYSLISWLRFLFSKNERLVLLAAYSGDKTVKLKDGKYFNFLVDPLVSGNILDRYIYAEQSVNGELKEPSFVRTDFKTDRFNAIIALYQRFFCKKGDTVSIAREIARSLDEHFKACNVELKVNAASIANTLQVFRSEYKCWRVLLKALRPALIISSEKPGTGFMAAAGSLGIPFVDLQHGVIDQFHPQYIHHPAMRLVKEEMVLPSFIGVFGQMHQELLLKNGFWDKSEIAILGSSRVEMNRKDFVDVKTTGNLVLLPTQWTCFEETKKLLKALAASGSRAFSIILKLHPLEPEAYAECYKTLASDNKDLITLADKDFNIYELILQVRMVIGFDSTVLLEAVSLGRPCITLTTPFAPKGILSLFDSENLGDAIQAVPYDDAGNLTALLENAVNDENYYQERVQRTAELSDYLYSKEYYSNCRGLVHDILNN